MKKLSTENAIIIDTETTGLGFDAEIVEFTAICADSGKVIVNELVKPTCSIPAEATAIHGITDVDVSDLTAHRALADCEMTRRLIHTVNSQLENQTNQNCDGVTNVFSE